LNATNYGGFNDWRLPTIKELASLINLGINDPFIPAINSEWFPNTATSNNYYWSTTTNSSNSSSARNINFRYGKSSYFDKSYDFYVRAVRGGQSELFDDSIVAGRLVDNSDGTITDTTTGLMWQQDNPFISSAWEQALIYCKNLNLAGHNDWRLPNKNELWSLVDFTRSGPATDPVAFPNTTWSSYWSSTSWAENPGRAKCVEFNQGGDWTYDKTSTRSIRSVRGGRSGSFRDLIIYSPVQGGEYADTVPIEWNPGAFIENVRILISKDGGGTFDEITASTLNDGYYETMVDGSSTVNGMLRIEDANNPDIFQQIGFYSFLATPPAPLGAVPSIPDTGQTACYDGENTLDPCPLPGDPFYGQDAQYQPQHPRSYTKLGANGVELTNNAFHVEDGGDWLMTRDNVTGLTWEIKHNKDGAENFSNPNDADNTYTWYDSNPETNGGESGTSGDGTDTEDFINALNTEGYGGFNDWRLPTIRELAYLINFDIPHPESTLNTEFFPNIHDTSAPHSGY